MPRKTLQRISSYFQRQKSLQTSGQHSTPKLEYTWSHPVAQCFQTLFFILLFCGSLTPFSDPLSNPRSMLFYLFVIAMAWPPRPSTTVLGKLEVLAIFLGIIVVIYRVMNPIPH